MKELSIRKAAPTDARVITEIAVSAFAVYVERMGKKPYPMLDDYAAHIAADHAWVLEEIKNIQAFAILIPQADASLMLDTIAVRPGFQRKGYGGALVAFAEKLASQLGARQVRVYTNVAMRENLAWYAALGFIEYERRLEKGYRRVFLRKDIS